MERVKLLVGNKEVEKRYVGNKLVWQKNLLKYLEGCYVEIKEDKLMLIDDDGDAKWLIKQVNDSYAQNNKNRLN